MAKPALTVVHGPPKSGKTRRIVQSALVEGGAPVLVAPTLREAAQLNRLVLGAGSETFAVLAITFPQLAAEILRLAERAPERTLNYTLQRMVLNELVIEYIGANDYLGKVLSAPRFVDALQHAVREWRMAGASADRFESALLDVAMQSPDDLFRRKLPNLIRILRGYEQFLHANHLVDDADVLRCAAAELTSAGSQIPFHARLIAFDGFHEFDELQIEMIHALAATGSGRGPASCRVALTLCHDDSRPLLYAATGRTLNRLKDKFATEEIKLTTKRDPDDAILDLSARLYSSPTHSDHVTDGTGERVNTDTRNSKSVDGPIHVLSAPNAYMETEMVAREFLQIRSTDQFSWADFGIVVRNAADYTETISSVFERFKIPFSPDVTVKLTRNPLIACLLTLLRVYRFGWKRPDVIAFLKSIYVSSDRMSADWVECAAKRLAVREEKQNWVNNVSTICAGLPETRAVINHMASLEPGICEPGISVGIRAQRLLDLVNDIGLTPGSRSSDPKSAAADSAALRSATAELTNLTLLERMRLTGPVDFAKFYDHVLKAWNQAGYHLPNEPDSVHLVEPHCTREYSFRVAAVMGLAEQVFPRRTVEDPFLRDDERILLSEAAGLHLEPRSNQADTERFLFYLAITAPTHHLILSYPRTGTERELLPSFFLDEVEACGTDLVSKRYTTLADTAPRLHIASHEREKNVGALASIFDPFDQPITIASSGDSTTVTAVQQLEQALGLQESSSAVLGSIVSRNLPNLPQLIARDLCGAFFDPAGSISIPELIAFARCPFHFMMRYRIGVEPDSRDRFTAAKLEIVRQTLCRFHSKYRIDSNSNPAKIYADLQVIAIEICATAVPDASPETKAMLRISVSGALRGVAMREYVYGTRFELNAAAFDLAYGFEAADASDRRHFGADPTRTNCTNRPLILRGDEDDYEVRISGVIDRIDTDRDGKSLILNFTSDRSADYGKLVRGEAVDLPLNMLAAERVFNHTAAVGCTDSLKEIGRRRLVRTQHAAPARFAPIEPFDDLADVRTVSREQYSQLVQTATRATIRLVRRIETSEVSAVPGEYCRTCAYCSICRTSIAGGRE